MKRLLLNIGRNIDKSLVHLGSAFLVVTMTAAFIDVITRTTVGATLAWAQKLAVWTIVFGATLLTGNQILANGHIRIDILFNRLEGLPRKVADIINNIAMVVFLFLFTAAGFNYTLNLKNTGVTRTFGTAHVPLWYIVGATMALTGVIMFIYSIISLVRAIKAPAKTTYEEAK